MEEAPASGKLSAPVEWEGRQFDMQFPCPLIYCSLQCCAKGRYAVACHYAGLQLFFVAIKIVQIQIEVFACRDAGTAHPSDLGAAAGFLDKEACFRVLPDDGEEQAELFGGIRQYCSNFIALFPRQCGVTQVPHAHRCRV